MESGITTGPIAPPRAEILAEVTYTHSEEDFVAWWMCDWEHTQNQRLHPLAGNFGNWVSVNCRYALKGAVIIFLAVIVLRERFIDYILVATACVFGGVLGKGLISWFLRGPNGLFRRLARWRYRCKMRRMAHQMAVRKMDIHLGRFHRLLLTADSCIHRVELHEIEPGSTLTERTETISSWTAFERIEVTDQHAFLFERRNCTTILPRHAFSDDASFRQFVELARRLHQTAIDCDVPHHRELPEERIAR